MIPSRAEERRISPDFIEVHSAGPNSSRFKDLPNRETISHSQAAVLLQNTSLPRLVFSFSSANPQMDLQDL